MTSESGIVMHTLTAQHPLTVLAINPDTLLLRMCAVNVERVKNLR